MVRSNLIPITRIYDIYPKYTYSDDVKKFMDEIVDIDRANVYTKDEVIDMLEDLLMEIKHTVTRVITMEEDVSSNEDLVKRDNVMKVVQSRINKLEETK